MNLIEKKIAPWLKNLSLYTPGKPIQELAKELNLNEEKIVKLASNENCFGMSPMVKTQILNHIDSLNRYPDGNCTELRRVISELHGVKTSQIIVGNGSNDILDCLSRTFLRKGTSAIYSQYSFAVYHLATVSTGANSIIVPSHENFGHDLEGFLSQIVDDTRVIFIANPNNPTGSFIDESKIKEFLKQVDKSIVVVLDEAYSEYLFDSDKINSINLLRDFPNLFVTRSFSKAYGLAGLRVGYGIGNEELIEFMNRVRQPFNVNSLAQKAAIAALQDQEFVNQSRILNSHIMSELTNGLSSIGIKYIPSKGNFVLVKIENTEHSNNEFSGIKLYESLLRFGVITRPVVNYNLHDWIRISVGTEKENKQLLNVLPMALDSMQKEKTSRNFSS